MLREAAGAAPDTLNQPLDWGPSLAFLKIMTMAIFVGCGLLELTIIFYGQFWSPRSLIVLGMLLVGLAGWSKIAGGNVRQAVLVLGIGTWLQVTIASFFLGGVASTVMVIYPFTILLVGWLVSVRAGIVMSAATILVTLGFVLAEGAGWLPAPPPTFPAMRWAVQATTFFGSAALIAYLVRSYRSQLEEVRDLGAALAKRTEALEAREADLHRAQAVAHIGSWIFDIANDKMHLSDETCRIFGLPVGTSGSHAAYLSRVHLDDRLALDSTWSLALRRSEPFDSEHRIVVRGQVRWVRQVAEFERGADGLPVRAVGTTQDITSRKLADEALRLTRIGVDSTSDALYWIDPEGQLVDVNLAACKTTGYTRDELLRMRITDIDPTIGAAAWAAHFDEVRDTGSSMFETFHRHREGHDIPVEVVCNHVRIGNKERLCGSVRDISERKRTQQAYRESELRLRDAQKLDAIGQLAGGIAHEFNNILAAMRGGLQLAQSELPMEHPARTGLTQAERSTKRAIGLVRQILTFSRGHESTLARLNMAQVVRDATQVLRAALPATIEIHSQIDDGAGFVSANAAAIQQVLMNLGLNAARAMPGGGRLDIAVGAVDVGAALAASITGLQPGPNVELSVRDTGIGMSPDVLSRIFEPFYTTTRSESPGLGLSVVYGIAREHRAAISVTSEPGKGTEFTLYFPEVDAVTAPAAPTTDAIGRAQSRGERLLFVDDEEDLVFLSRRLLEKAGYKVDACRSAEEALALFEREPAHFDAIISDLTMRGMSGLELAERALAIRPGMPLILMSGHVRESDNARARALGIGDIQWKPNTVTDLAITLRQRLEQGRPVT